MTTVREAPHIINDRTGQPVDDALTWRMTFVMVARALLGMSAALHRIADVLEREGTPHE